MASPTSVAAALPSWIRWEPADPGALEAALAEGRRGVFPGRVRLPWGAIDWPIEVLDVTPGLRFTTSTTNRWFRRFVHRRRVERAVGHKVRLADEVVLEPAAGWSPLVVEAVRRVLLATQTRLVDGLDAIPSHAVVYPLGQVDLGHAEALLGGIDLGLP